jgi:hypothetical protein
MYVCRDYSYIRRRESLSYGASHIDRVFPTVPQNVTVHTGSKDAEVPTRHRLGSYLLRNLRKENKEQSVIPHANSSFDFLIFFLSEFTHDHSNDPKESLSIRHRDIVLSSVIGSSCETHDYDTIGHHVSCVVILLYFDKSKRLRV